MKNINSLFLCLINKNFKKQNTHAGWKSQVHQNTFFKHCSFLTEETRNQLTSKAKSKFYTLRLKCASLCVKHKVKQRNFIFSSEKLFKLNANGYTLE